MFIEAGYTLAMGCAVASVYSFAAQSGTQAAPFRLPSRLLVDCGGTGKGFTIGCAIGEGRVKGGGVSARDDLSMYRFFRVHHPEGGCCAAMILAAASTTAGIDIR
jgi:hypothetical protein